MKKKEKVNENLKNLSYEEKLALVAKALYEAGVLRRICMTKNITKLGKNRKK